MNEMEEVKKGVQDSIDIIKRNVKAYIFERDDSTYRSIAIELRKILLDTNATASFTGFKRKHQRSLFELYYGNGKNILLQSFLGAQESKKGTSHVPVTPTIYSNRVDILYQAMCGDKLVILPNWLDEHFVYTESRIVQKLRTVLQHIADKEGSHIIKSKKGDIRKGAQIAFAAGPVTSNDISSLQFIDHWAQLIVGVGMRLLNAKKASDKSFLIEHGIVAPKKMMGKIIRIEKKRK